MIRIKVDNKEFKVEEARTPEELKKGLSEKDSLDKDEGMLFYFEPPQPVSFTMKDTKIPLDIVFIDEDEEVIQVSKAKPGLESIPCNDPVAYVLEVNLKSGILIGQTLEFPDEQGPIMKVLAADGSAQMELWGGERIFSRKNTAILVKKAKKADLTKEDKDYKALGRYMFKCIKGLDERPAEYVDAPTKSAD